MTKGAIIESALPVQFAGIDDVSPFAFFGILKMKSDMLASGAMASLAVNAEHYLIRIKCFMPFRGLPGFEIRTMTFQASCRDAPVEYHLIGGVARTITPSIIGGVVRNRKLEERVALPT